MILKAISEWKILLKPFYKARVWNPETNIKEIDKTRKSLKIFQVLENSPKLTRTQVRKIIRTSKLNPNGMKIGTNVVRHSYFRTQKELLDSDLKQSRSDAPKSYRETANTLFQAEIRVPLR